MEIVELVSGSVTCDVKARSPILAVDRAWKDRGIRTREPSAEFLHVRRQWLTQDATLEPHPEERLREPALLGADVDEASRLQVREEDADDPQIGVLTVQIGGAIAWGVHFE